ncbi:hypothetical protein PF005_g8686 [Phytophthora fragariae]|uniref:Uncharacterized protein n=1 Tax=Phytophthora fragariae TaxID=53985 RepID=A0A6A3YFF5_9STRA|nr:hypothetical protein PF011_g6797 [Phytophthora fragariae]KAE9087368.1 hypothetical protein PF010_g19751 [Phytophthora fragariae]KAE9123178.1 hypothetical protein PF007_g7149 [Phytophthora fragariae]KAE9201286.1 hypothetical protein PF004_g18757 [Phytophthora fragariae]KAE9217346.1 hypothetical protein PF005_g8686 [Phytophthora fragariae]
MYGWQPHGSMNGGCADSMEGSRTGSMEGSRTGSMEGSYTGSMEGSRTGSMEGSTKSGAKARAMKRTGAMTRTAPRVVPSQYSSQWLNQGESMEYIGRCVTVEKNACRSVSIAKGKLHST